MNEKKVYVEYGCVWPQSTGSENGMDLAQDYLTKNSVFTEPIAQHSNAIDLAFSYVTCFTPINPTTEIQVLTREVRTDELLGGASLVLNNDVNPLLIAQLLALQRNVGLDYLAVPGNGISMETEDVTEISESNEWPIRSTYSLKALSMMEVPGARDLCDLQSILQSVPLSLFNNELTATQIWLDTLPVNTLAPKETPKNSSAKLVYQQLRERARTEAEEIGPVLIRFQRELEQLFVGPLQPAFASTRRAVRVRGKLPGLWKERLVKGTIVDEELNIQEEISFQITREPKIRQGELILSLTTPARLIGRTANILLSIEEREILLGIVAIEAGEDGTARIELEVDLQSVGVSIKDGRLSADAFQVIVEES